jgi:hypothetical protein
MKTRLAISLVMVATLGVLLGSAARPARSAEPAVCGEFTPARLLEDPRIAHRVYGAIGRGDAAAEARFHEMVAEMRAVHGCGALEEPSAGLPQAPRLPPGHPPITDAPAAPVFSEDARIISL